MPEVLLPEASRRRLQEFKDDPKTKKRRLNLREKEERRECQMELFRIFHLDPKLQQMEEIWDLDRHG